MHRIPGRRQYPARRNEKMKMAATLTRQDQPQKQEKSTDMSKQMKMFVKLPVFLSQQLLHSLTQGEAFSGYYVLNPECCWVHPRRVSNHGGETFFLSEPQVVAGNDAMYGLPRAVEFRAPHAP